MSQINEIRGYIQEDDLETALVLLVDACRILPSKYQNELTLHRSSWKNLKESERKGLLTRDEFVRGSLKLKSAILEFLDVIEEKIRESEPLKSSSVGVAATETGPRKLRVFICHASQDKHIVRDLYQKLAAEPWIDPWLDKEKLLPGQDWNLEIEKAVESSDAVIVCVSSTSIAKEGYIQKELRKVLDIALEKLEGAIFVLPVRLDDCPLPRQLRDKQALDYFPPSDRAGAFEKLKAALSIRKESLGK